MMGATDTYTASEYEDAARQVAHQLAAEGVDPEVAARLAGTVAIGRAAERAGSPHPYCLNCGGSFGQHVPEGLLSCGEWWPSTMGPEPEDV